MPHTESRLKNQDVTFKCACEKQSLHSDELTQKINFWPELNCLKVSQQTTSSEVEVTTSWFQGYDAICYVKLQHITYLIHHTMYVIHACLISFIPIILKFKKFGWVYFRHQLYLIFQTFKSSEMLCCLIRVKGT